MVSSGIAQWTPAPDLIDLGPGCPEASLLPVDAVADAAQKAWRSIGPSSLAYGHNSGPGPLRNWIAASIAGAGGDRISPDDVVITCGASHALNLVCEQLAVPGEIILVEDPGYYLAWDLFRERRLRPRGIPVDAAGMSAQHLADSVRALRSRGGDRQVGLLPVHVPESDRSLHERGASAGADRLRCQSQFLLIDDEAYRDLAFDGAARPCLWCEQSDLEDVVIRVGTFSKTIGPGIRTGWIVPPRRLRDQLADCALHRSGGGMAHLSGLAVAEYCCPETTYDTSSTLDVSTHTKLPPWVRRSSAPFLPAGSSPRTVASSCG